MDNAINELVQKIILEKFQEIYGSSIENLLLVQQKTVTISNLRIMPEGTINPSTTLYNTTMFAMAGLLAIAFICNLLISPYSKHHMKD